MPEEWYHTKGPFTDWREFKETCAVIGLHKVFRGQKDENWGLESSLDRWGPQRELSTSFDRRVSSHFGKTSCGKSSCFHDSRGGHTFTLTPHLHLGTIWSGCP